MGKLTQDYYLQTDVVSLAKDLLGKSLFSCFEGKLTGGIITETEAYAGITDKASHAYGDRRTPRTEVMYAQGGLAYIYLCYGMYSLFNVVTNVSGIPHAVLIRGILPTLGLDVMESRILKSPILKEHSDGPGKLTKALGIHYVQSGTSLLGNTLWIEDCGLKVVENQIKIGPRIGVNYAGEDALLPYRFCLLNDY